MLTRSRKALETIEWIGIGVVLIIVAVLAYRVLGAQIVSWIQTVAAAIVGGVSISGGVGTVPGVLLGALLLGIIQNSLTLIRISPFWQLAVQGLLILIAVVTDHLISRRIQQRNNR